MSKQNETGHAKNVANLIKYNDYITSLGAAYNPPQAELGLVAMGTLCTSAQARLSAVEAAEKAWKKETNAREAAFAGLSNLCSRVLGALKATGASKQTVDDLNALIKKIRGGGSRAGRAKKNSEAGTAGALPAATRSTSQRSYDLRLDHFSGIVTLMRTVDGYAPNEADMSITGLQGLYVQLSSHNSKVSQAAIALHNARSDRDAFFYTPNTGVLDLVKKSKAYIVSVFGKNSDQYRHATSFRLTQVVS